MKKEFGKWLMDIAKYVATAGVLTSIMGGIKSGITLYILSFCVVFLTY
ncbi:DUF6722 family protein [Hoylesella saccharolytica]|nr:DUF6722 family protein [Hoylesella saccharolytica]